MFQLYHNFQTYCERKPQTVITLATFILEVVIGIENSLQ